ncbi:MAG: RHS repeat-associated core domain-containing protein, partial [Fimbriimonadaceae bacterium]
YNLGGWVEAVTDSAADETLVGYDEWGRVVGIEHSDESVVSLVYNLEGLIVSATDELSRTGYRVYNDRYDLTGTENARGDDHAFAYNDAGWLTSVTNGRSYARTYAYTVRGEVYTLTLADESVESWAYDANGQTSSYTNALSQTIGYAYNDAGDLTAVDYPTGTDTTFSYDGAGRTVSMADATGTSSWTFNAAGEVTALETPQGDLEYVYDLSGAVTEMTVDGTATTEYGYDAYGRFSSLTNQFSEVTSVTYDSAGRVSRKDFDSGVYEAFTYDDRSRPTLVLVKNSSNTEIDRKEYVWDDASRVTSAKEGGYWSYYEYDAIDQLIEEEKPALSYLATYTYDANGNRATRTVNSVTETYAYDEADKLETVTVNSNVVKEFTYDDAGRTTAIETSAGTTSFAYDYEGRVTQITYPSTSSDSFGYNGLGARASTSGTNGSRSFLRNGLGVTSPVLEDGVAEYTPGVSRRASSSTTFAHAGQKNTSAQSAENETVAASRVYDAFGNVVSSSGSWSGPFGYAGEFGYQEDGNGLRLLGHRYYDSTTGRFLTSDPIQNGRNWYEYCGNNPITQIDPTGLTWYYDQRTGQLWWDDPATAEFDPVLKGTGYAGTAGDHRNNPDSEDLEEQGPLPKGEYKISKRKTTKREGRPLDCFWIDPVAGTEMYGRTGMLIHGDNSRGDASTGCIVLSKGLRDEIEDSDDTVLIVYDSGSDTWAEWGVNLNPIQLIPVLRLPNVIRLPKRWGPRPSVGPPWNGPMGTGSIPSGWG